MRFPKCLLKNEQVLPLLERWSEEAGTGKDLGMLQLDSYVLYAVEEDVLLMVDVADFFIKSPMKAS